MQLRIYQDGLSGYVVEIAREPERIKFETFEEAEAKMKELYGQYGMCPNKYRLLDCSRPNIRPQYICDREGNVVMY